MQPSQVLVLVSILFGLGGLLLGFLLGAAWASRHNPAEAEEETGEPAGTPAGENASLAPPVTLDPEPTSPDVVEIKQPLPAGPAAPAAPPTAEVLPSVPTSRPTGSMIEQINTILVDLTAETPLAGRNIHLAQDQQLGVVVWVGSQRYDGVDRVPQEEIRSIIQAAVRKWEES